MNVRTPPTIRATLRKSSGPARTFCSSTEQRGALLPFVIPRGSSKAELGVPSFVYEPFQAARTLLAEEGQYRGLVVRITNVGPAWGCRRLVSDASERGAISSAARQD
jgi:hypothetical protein